MAQNLPLLRLFELPVFGGAVDFARLVHVSARLVNIYRKNSARAYRTFSLPKAGGGARTIEAPSRRLKALQAWILRRILARVPRTPYATAYHPGSKLLDNVLPHETNRYFLCIDLSDFFTSIKRTRVTKLFSLMGYSNRSATLLSDLCCTDHLPQGAVTSPAISNLVAAKLDRRIAGYAARKGIAYTRYADDITISCNNPRLISRCRPMIFRIIKNEHFTVNLRKTRQLGPKSRIIVTGLTKDSSEPHFGISRSVRRAMRARYCLAVYRGTFDSEYPSMAALDGWLNYLRTVDPVSYQRFATYRTNLLSRHAAAGAVKSSPKVSPGNTTSVSVPASPASKMNPPSAPSAQPKPTPRNKP